MTALPHTHPLGEAIRNAAYRGKEPTTREVDALFASIDAPDGTDLRRLRRQLVAACKDVVAVARPEAGVINYGEAQALADDYIAKLWDQMDEGERGAVAYDERSLDDLAGMFDR